MNRLTLRKARKNNNRRGAMVVLVAAMLVVLFGMCAFAVDLGYLTTTKATLGASADAAALAAAGSLRQAYGLTDVRAVAVNYAQRNVPVSYGTVIDETDVTFGVWNPETQTLTPSNDNPNAVRVVVKRTQARGNSVPFFLGRVFGQQSTDLSAEAIAVGAINTPETSYSKSVYVTSSKDLSNVVLEFADGQHQKFEGLHGYTGTFQGTGVHAGKEVVGVWIKSGCNESGDGPGYGERIDNPGDGSTVHGRNVHRGCTPHVTATFESTGVQFTDTGSVTPVRLVR